MRTEQTDFSERSEEKDIPTFVTEPHFPNRSYRDAARRAAKKLMRSSYYKLAGTFPSVIPTLIETKRQLIRYRDRWDINRSGLFDENYYLTKNLDVKAARVDPLDHYLNTGGLEGRNPHPGFDSRTYLQENADIVLHKLNPLLHYVRYGRKEGRKAYPAGTASRSFSQTSNDLETVLSFISREGSRGNQVNSSRRSSIILPVFNGYEHLCRLLPSLKDSVGNRHNIIIIDDGSTDNRVKNLLRNFCEGSSVETTLITHEANIGFVKSVNEAAAFANSHFIILNSDTQVNADWVERLMGPIFEDNRVSSTTPFTNAGTIFSFPKQMEDNRQLPSYFELQELDEACRSLAADQRINLDAPTGVGFCMGINKSVWDEIGGFDSESFGRGFGEETDWCRRAISAGYRNVLAYNVFVYHFHGGSFSELEKASLLDRNGSLVNDRWPTYPIDAGTHITADPWQILRAALLLNVCTSKGMEIVIDHDLGGGANDYRRKLVKDRLQRGKIVALCTFDFASSVYKVNLLFDEVSFLYCTDNAKTVLSFLKKVEKGRIYYNNLVSWDNPLSVISFMREWQSSERLVEFMVHDFYSICPSFSLLSNSDEYCGIPEDIRICKRCLRKNANAAVRADISEWRDKWGRLLTGATKITCFSNSSADILRRAYPYISNNLDVIPHAPLVSWSSDDAWKPSGGNLTIGVVGGISVQKGATLVANLDRLLRSRGLNTPIIVIGEIDTRFITPGNTNIRIHGRYRREELPSLLRKYEISLCLMPSVIPETFSYSTQELMALGVPLVSFNIGAPAERIRTYERGEIAHDISAESAWDAIRRLERRFIASN